MRTVAIDVLVLRTLAHENTLVVPRQDISEDALPSITAGEIASASETEFLDQAVGEPPLIVVVALHSSRLPFFLAGSIGLGGMLKE
jgi:hypothetical protein